MKIEITNLIRSARVMSDGNGGSFYAGEKCEKQDYEAIIHKIAETLRQCGVIGDISLISKGDRQ